MCIVGTVIYVFLSFSVLSSLQRSQKLNPDTMTPGSISIARRLLAEHNATHSLMQSQVSLSVYYTPEHRLRSAHVCSKEGATLSGNNSAGVNHGLHYTELSLALVVVLAKARNSRVIPNRWISFHLNS